MADSGVHFKTYYKVVYGLVRTEKDRETFEKEVESYLNTGWELQDFYVLGNPATGAIDIAYQTLTLVADEDA